MDKKDALDRVYYLIGDYTFGTYDKIDYPFATIINEIIDDFIPINYRGYHIESRLYIFLYGKEYGGSCWMDKREDIIRFFKDYKKEREDAGRSEVMQ